MTIAKNAGSQVAPKRRIMRALKINEISGVDAPAQQGAVAVIMKRKGDPGYDPKKPKSKKQDGADPQTDQTEELEKRSALTTEERGHVHLMVLNGPPDGVDLNAGETSFEDGHTHPWVRTEGGPIVIGISKSTDGQPHTHMVAVMSKNEDDSDNIQPAGDAGTVGTEGDTTMTDKTQKAGEPTVEELQAQLARANSIASLNDAEKSHFSSLEGDAQDVFLAKSADERKSEIKKVATAAQDDDPVVYTTNDGIELRKSVGEAFLAIAKSNDALRKDNDELRKKSEQEALEKRADADLSHLPGTVVERAAMLKAIDGIEDESQRTAAMNALKAQNEAMSTAFVNAGTSVHPAPGSSEESLDGLAKAHQTANPGVSFEQAYDAVLKTDAGRELYAKSVN